MIKYFPTFLAGTSEGESLSVTVISDKIAIQEKDVQIVIIEKNDNVLRELECDSTHLGNGLRIVSFEDRIQIITPPISELTESYKQCVINDQSLLAIKILVPNAINQADSENISAKQSILVPVYLEVGSPLLAENRVLGATETLIQSSLQCARETIYEKEEFVCNLSLKNVSDYPIIARVISQKHSITNTEQIEVDNLLLTKGGSKSVSIPINIDDIQFGRNELGTVITISSVSGKGLPYSVSNKAAYNYIPWYAIVFVIGLIFVISVILKNYIQNKLTAPKNGKRKEKITNTEIRYI